MQFLRHRLGERRADVLTDLGFPGENGDRAVLGHVQPRADLLRHPLGEAAAAPGFLSLAARGHQQHDQAAADTPEEVAAVQLESVPDGLGQLVAFEFDAHRDASGRDAACRTAATMRW